MSRHEDDHECDEIPRVTQKGEGPDDLPLEGTPECILPPSGTRRKDEKRSHPFEWFHSVKAWLKGEEIQPQSWCPGGSASGGICSPSNNTRHRWMELYTGCRYLPIGESLLLASHNAGYDKLAPRAPSNETCQDTHIKEQLAWGVRVLDLRVQFASGGQGPGRFQIFHDTPNGRNVETDVLERVFAFRKQYNAHREIVILDFHEFKYFTPAAHQELANLLKSALGTTLVPYACKDAAVMQLWHLQMNTVVAYNYQNGLNGLFWPGVNQRWVGSNTPGKDELGDFIKRVGTEPKPFGELRSVQAAYYSLPMFVPKDLSEDLMNWFAAPEDGWPITGHYIISIDWALRQRLADNIIYANAIRSRQRGAHVVSSSPNTAGASVQTQAYGIYAMSNGDWADRLQFAPNTSGSTSIVLISSAADWNSEITWDGARKKRQISRDTCLLFRVESQQEPVLIAEFKEGVLVTQ